MANENPRLAIENQTGPVEPVRPHINPYYDVWMGAGVRAVTMVLAKSRGEPKAGSRKSRELDTDGPGNLA